jgi:uncharacterized protein (DUF362 family)
MHAKSTRREFLWQSAVATGGLLLPAQLSWAAPSETKMVITKWTGPSPQSPTEFAKIATQLTEQAVATLGGMSRFVKRGDVVWIKPNIGWDRTPELGANTNPDVVATLVRLCLDAGAKVVKVGDNPCDLPQKAYASSGIADAARKAGAQVVFLDRDRFREMDIKGERVKTIPVYPEIVESDVVINVPIAKHHVLATATLCMKNYMGVIENRRVFHQDIPTCLADITRFMRPSLCLLDCTRVMLAHGPKGGNIEDVAVRLTLAAGTDIVALDAFGAEMLGRKPSDIGSIVKGHQVGLGTMDYRSLQPKEITLS